MLVEILSWLGGITVIVGATTAAAFALFRFFAQGWIASKFTAQLEESRHENAKELQRLKVRIESMLAGTIKLQDREFSVIPEIWQKLNEAYGRTVDLTSALQLYPNVGDMSDVELEEFLGAAQLKESQKAQLRTAQPDDRMQVYQSIEWRVRLGQTRRSLGEFGTSINRDGVFLPDELREQFELMWKDLSSALISFEMSKQHAQPAIELKLTEKVSALQTRYDAIRKSVIDRLRAHAATPE